MSYISAIRPQAIEDAQENSSWYGEYASGGRIYLYFDHTDDLEWATVKPLVTSIEDSVEDIDDRYPSVRLADAA